MPSTLVHFKRFVRFADQLSVEWDDLPDDAMTSSNTRDALAPTNWFYRTPITAFRAFS